jgi:hypothetical protein
MLFFYTRATHQCQVASTPRTWRRPFCHLARHVCVDSRLHHHQRRRMQLGIIFVYLRVSSFAAVHVWALCSVGVALIKTRDFDTLSQPLTMWRYKSEETDVMVQFNKARTHCCLLALCCRRRDASHSIEMRRKSAIGMMVDSQWHTQLHSLLFNHLTFPGC